MSGETVTVLVNPDHDTATVRVDETISVDVQVGDDTVTVQGVASVGPAGPQGPPGVDYVFTQDVASALWTIAHNLDVFPNVTVADTLDRQVEGDVTYIDSNTVTVAFAAPATGRAFLA